MNMTRLNDYDKSHVQEAVLKASQRLTPENAPEVRNLLLQITNPESEYAEGQHIGVIVPGPHGYGHDKHFRLYTIANTPHTDAKGNVDIELCVRRCFTIDAVSGEQYPGIASNYLCDAHPGDIVITSGPYGDKFTMPEDNHSNLLMIGSGTGIAPFRAFIQHIYQQRSDWQGQVRLYYGARSGMEKLYQNDLKNDFAEYYDQQTFQAFAGLSRKPWMHDAEDSGLSNVLEENAQQIWELIQQPQTWVYIAGLSKTVHQFARVMIKVAGSEARWRWTREEMIEQKRWSELVYD
jgi:ferredoxin--NADP+ reductase